ncbi:MAG: glycosyltransferase family 39 protein [Verrucomicrobiales bacterium]|nr:glycosyltransferase family 39 protein [Verrucomicrobiales bacterium]
MNSASSHAPAAVRLQVWGLPILLGVYLLLVSLMPLAAAIQIGADEGFELAKTLLVERGFRLYTDVWSDQPPLYTLALVGLQSGFPGAILPCRLLSVFLTLVLLVALFELVKAIEGRTTALVTIALLIASPGFLELSVSCMQEIPALSLGIAALSVIHLRKAELHPRWIVAGGFLFGASVAMKLITLYLLPVMMLLLSWGGDHRQTLARFIKVLPGFAVSVGCTLALIAVFLPTESMVSAFQQIREAHFANGVSSEFGGPEQHGFDWNALLKNWDQALPAACALLALAIPRKGRRTWNPGAAWLGYALILFAWHRPWWSYYYVHVAMPLCWCAARGLTGAWAMTNTQRRFRGILRVGSLAILTWMSARVCLEIRDLGRLPRIDSSLALQEIRARADRVQWLFTDDPVYSFHAGIPLPPRLAVVSLKRMWSGSLTRAAIVDEVRTKMPELILLRSTSDDSGFGGLLEGSYELTFRDGIHHLYIRNASLREL